MESSYPFSTCFLVDTGFLIIGLFLLFLLSENAVILLSRAFSWTLTSERERERERNPCLSFGEVEGDQKS